VQEWKEKLETISSIIFMEQSFEGRSPRVLEVERDFHEVNELTPLRG
jgi:hypothetical protein